MDHQKQFVLSFLAYAAQRDISIAELSKNASIDLRAVKRDVKYTLTRRQFDDLWFYASHSSNDPLFGLHFGESLQLSALGVVGEIIKSSRTVGGAIQLAASLTHLITDLVSMNIRQSKKTFTIELLPAKFELNDFTIRQMTDFLIVFIVHELDGLLLEKIRPLSVSFPYTVSHVSEYERVLRCRPSKKKDRLAISFNNKYWNESIISANYAIQNFLLQTVNDKKGKQPESFSERMVHYLMANAYLGILSLEDVAANFNMAPRSLQRRLQDEHVTFQQLSDSVRKSLALNYIKSGKHPVKAISNMLGYNELSAFSRAFKRWTGKAPTNYLS